MSFRITFTRQGRRHTQWRDTQEAADEYVDYLVAQRDREDIEIVEAARPMTLEQRIDALIDRLDGIRVGEGQDTVDLGDLRP